MIGQLRILAGFFAWAVIPHRAYRPAESPIVYDSASRALWRDMVESATVIRPAR